MKRLIFFLILFITSFLLFQCASYKNTQKGAEMDIKISYPETKKKVVVDTLFGVEIPDPYRWLEDFESEKVQEWVENQNKLYYSVVEQLSKEEKIYDEYMKLYSTKLMGLPKRYGNTYFFQERDGLMNHSITYMVVGSIDGEKIEIINPNEWSEDGTINMDWMQPSPDGSLVVYGKSEKGSEVSTLHILDVEEGQHLSDVIERTRHPSIAWLPDKSGFYYSKNPKKGEVPEGDENYYRRLFFHKIGKYPEDDPLVFGEGRGKEEWIDAILSSQENYIIISSYLGAEKNDLYLKRVKEGGEIKTIAEGLENSFQADVFDGKVYIYTNWNAPKGRIMVADIENLSPDDWKELIHESEGIIESFHIVGGKLVVKYMQDVYTKISIFELNGEHLYDLDFPTMGSADIFGSWDSPELLCSFESFFYPITIYRFNLDAGKRETIFQLDVGRDLGDYELKQIRYPSKDGTLIPLWIMYKKGVNRDRDNPTILSGYGGFNVSRKPYFTRTLFPWLDRGGIYSIACLRGGGEFGEEWHKAGMLSNKQNVFDDFIAASEYLIEKNWTNPDKLTIWGGSNGGLLVGAALTQRPDLYKVVVCTVPLLDMLRYHNFHFARIWIPEYGSVESKEQFKYIKEYSPYHNVYSDKDYPAVHFFAGQSDTRVHPMHAMKMAALMQDVVGFETPILLYVEPKSGHAGKPLIMALRDISHRYLFVMWQLGMI